ncbi:MAG: nicotinate phosphoribosyltransferase [Methermicoccaceae archaeon]
MGIEMFNIPRDEDIKQGRTTDVYFLRTEEVLKAKRINPRVVAEVTSSKGTIVFSGLDEAMKLLEGLPIDVYAVPEGTLIHPREPVLYIEGKYLDFARYETALLGFLCHASGIATNAARVRFAAGNLPVYSFGSRRVHPALSMIVERSAWIGGVDGVSNILASDKLDIPVVGTMPHSLIIAFGD